MEQRLIDANVLKNTITKHSYIVRDRINSTGEGMFTVGIMQAIDEQPTIEAIPISFIEEQAKLCNEVGFVRGEECYIALIEDWREENDTDRMDNQP
jgi:hypothetical protein